MSYFAKTLKDTFGDRIPRVVLDGLIEAQTVLERTQKELVEQIEKKLKGSSETLRGPLGPRFVNDNNNSTSDETQTYSAVHPSCTNLWRGQLATPEMLRNSPPAVRRNPMGPRRPMKFSAIKLLDEMPAFRETTESTLSPEFDRGMRRPESQPTPEIAKQLCYADHYPASPMPMGHQTPMSHHQPMGHQMSRRMEQQPLPLGMTLGYQHVPSARLPLGNQETNHHESDTHMSHTQSSSYHSIGYPNMVPIMTPVYENHKGKMLLVGHMAQHPVDNPSPCETLNQNGSNYQSGQRGLRGYTPPGMMNEDHRPHQFHYENGAGASHIMHAGFRRTTSLRRKLHGDSGPVQQPRTGTMRPKVGKSSAEDGNSSKPSGPFSIFCGFELSKFFRGSSDNKVEETRAKNVEQERSSPPPPNQTYLPNHNQSRTGRQFVPDTTVEKGMVYGGSWRETEILFPLKSIPESSIQHTGDSRILERFQEPTTNPNRYIPTPKNPSYRTPSNDPAEREIIRTHLERKQSPASDLQEKQSFALSAASRNIRVQEIAQNATVRKNPIGPDPSPDRVKRGKQEAPIDELRPNQKSNLSGTHLAQVNGRNGSPNNHSSPSKMTPPGSVGSIKTPGSQSTMYSPSALVDKPSRSRSIVRAHPSKDQPSSSSTGIKKAQEVSTEQPVSRQPKTETLNEALNRLSRPVARNMKLAEVRRAPSVTIKVSGKGKSTGETTPMTGSPKTVIKLMSDDDEKQNTTCVSKCPEVATPRFGPLPADFSQEKCFMDIAKEIQEELKEESLACVANEECTFADARSINAPMAVRFLQVKADTAGTKVSNRLSGATSVREDPRNLDTVFQSEEGLDSFVPGMERPSQNPQSATYPASFGKPQDWPRMESSFESMYGSPNELSEVHGSPREVAGHQTGVDIPSLVRVPGVIYGAGVPNSGPCGSISVVGQVNENRHTGSGEGLTKDAGALQSLPRGTELESTETALLVVGSHGKVSVSESDDVLSGMALSDDPRELCCKDIVMGTTTSGEYEVGPDGLVRTALMKRKGTKKIRITGKAYQSGPDEEEFQLFCKSGRKEYIDACCPFYKEYRYVHAPVDVFYAPLERQAQMAEENQRAIELETALFEHRSYTRWAMGMRGVNVGCPISVDVQFAPDPYIHGRIIKAIPGYDIPLDSALAKAIAEIYPFSPNTFVDQGPGKKPYLLSPLGDVLELRIGTRLPEVPFPVDEPMELWMPNKEKHIRALQASLDRWNPLLDDYEEQRSSKLQAIYQDVDSRCPPRITVERQWADPNLPKLVLVNEAGEPRILNDPEVILPEIAVAPKPETQQLITGNTATLPPLQKMTEEEYLRISGNNQAMEDRRTSGPDATYVQIDPETGKVHQIPKPDMPSVKHIAEEDDEYERRRDLAIAKVQDLVAKETRGRALLARIKHFFSGNLGDYMDAVHKYESECIAKYVHIIPPTREELYGPEVYKARESARLIAKAQPLDPLENSVFRRVVPRRMLEVRQPWMLTEAWKIRMPFGHDIDSDFVWENVQISMGLHDHELVPEGWCVVEFDPERRKAGTGLYALIGPTLVEEIIPNYEEHLKVSIPDTPANREALGHYHAFTQSNISDGLKALAHVNLEQAVSNANNVMVN